MKQWWFIGTVAVLLIVFAIGLTLQPDRVPSPLVGKKAPEFCSVSLLNPTETFCSSELDGQAYLMNVWASWCAACIDEHDKLKEISEVPGLLLVSINYKDERSNALRWLQQLGNPFDRIAYDFRGDVAMEWGVFGAPETFLVDAAGMIIHKHVGPITDRAWQQEFEPLLADAGRTQ